MDKEWAKRVKVIEKELKAVEKQEKKLQKAGILGGFRLNKTDSIWCVTEKVSKQAMDEVVRIFTEGK